MLKDNSPYSLALLSVLFGLGALPSLYLIGEVTGLMLGLASCLLSLTALLRARQGKSLWYALAGLALGGVTVFLALA